MSETSRLDVDVIVNAANEQLRPGGGVYGAIYRARLGRSGRGGGVGEAALLASCDRRSSQLPADIAAVQVAFPAISIGVFGCPAPEAAWVAVAMVRAVISSNRWPGVIFCCFDPVSAELCRAALQSAGTNGSG